MQGQNLALTGLCGPNLLDGGVVKKYEAQCMVLEGLLSDAVLARQVKTGFLGL